MSNFGFFVSRDVWILALFCLFFKIDFLGFVFLLFYLKIFNYLKDNFNPIKNYEKKEIVDEKKEIF